MRVNVDKLSVAFLPYIDHIYNNYLTITDVKADPRFSHMRQNDLKSYNDDNLKVRTNLI